MQNLLADLCVESEAHTLLAMRMARLFNDATNHERAGDPLHESGHIFRVGIAVSKYYITKRLPNLVYECMEAHGGNGFVEDLPMARMYRHAPLNSIWEGSGNVMTLDVLRAAQHLPLLMKEIKECVPLGNAALNSYIQALEKDLFRLLKGATTPESMLELQRHARNLVDRLAVALQASVLMRFGCPVMAEMYVESRVFNGRGDSRGMNFGSTVYSADNLKHVLQENIPTGLLLSV
jgi:putative acyl-CoA dehydrogenase